MNLIKGFSVFISTLFFAPDIYKMSESSLITTSSNPYDYDLINVNVDLRLLFGDLDNDKEISYYEFKNFDFDRLVPKFDDLSVSQYIDFNLLTFKPVYDDIYFYIWSTYDLANDYSVSVTYSDSTVLIDDGSSGYLENNKTENLIYLNRYSYLNGFFYKFKLDDFTIDYDEENEYRIRIFEFVLNSNDRFVYDFSNADFEMFFKGNDFLNNHYYYFKNNCYFYEAKLGMVLGILSTEDYFPITSCFYIRGNEASESNVKSAQELFYLFVDFSDSLDVSDLISVDVEYYKLSYDYVRYVPYYEYNDEGVLTSNEEKQMIFNDIFAGRYRSKEFGYLENGLSLNGETTSLSMYDEDVLVFDSDGNSSYVNLNYDEFELLSDNSNIQTGPDVSDLPFAPKYFNPDFNSLYNGFYNVKVLNGGKSYHKTIYDNYNESDYSYEQVNNSSSYWDHAPLIRSYSFKPIVNLNDINSEFSGDEYKLSLEYFNTMIADFKNQDFCPDFAILIDGANTDSDCERSINTDSEVLVKTGQTLPTSGQNRNYKYSLIKDITTAHEIYNVLLLKATARQNNGENITFNCLGEPAYAEYVNFVGFKAPSLVDYILNDVKTLFDKLGDWVYLILGILGLIIILVLIPILLPFVKIVIKIIIYPFKAIYRLIKNKKRR